MSAVLHHGFLRRRPLIGAAGIVVVVHGLALFAFALVVRGAGPPVEAVEEMVEVMPADEESVQQVVEAPEEPPPRPAPMIFGPAVALKVAGPRPAEARFIARVDADPARETRARGPRNSRLEEAPLARTPSPAGGEHGDSVASPALALPEGEGPRPETVTAEAVAPPPPPAQAAGAMGAGEAPSIPEVPQPERPPAAPDLELPVADTTAVRARESAMTDFLLEVQRLVARHWHPTQVYARVDPQGKLPGIERRTALLVRVRANGGLERVDIATTSGVAELDQEAREAFQRAQPLPAPPAAGLDAKGGLSFPFSVSLDLLMARWKSEVERQIRNQWRPPRSYRFHTDRERNTVVRVLLTFDGVVAHVGVETSSGSSFLDASAISALPPGLRLPAPPPAVGEIAGLVPVRVAFVHRTRGGDDLHILLDPSAQAR